MNSFFHKFQFWADMAMISENNPYTYCTFVPRHPIPIHCVQHILMHPLKLACFEHCLNSWLCNSTVSHRKSRNKTFFLIVCMFIILKLFWGHLNYLRSSETDLECFLVSFLALSITCSLWCDTKYIFLNMKKELMTSLNQFDNVRKNALKSKEVNSPTPVNLCKWHVSLTMFCHLSTRLPLSFHLSVSAQPVSQYELL